MIFTAFSDTAEYIYICLADKIKSEYGLNVALVTGNVEARSTMRLREKLDFNKVLTLFSPILCLRRDPEKLRCLAEP